MVTKCFFKTTRLSFILSFLFFFTQAQVRPGTQTNGSEVTNVIVAVPFLLITPDARTGAMGEAGVAVLPDANAMSVNPSKLAYLEDPYGFSASYSPWLNNLNSDINLVYLSGYYKVAENAALGTSLRYFSLGAVQLFDRDLQDLGTYRPNEFALDVAYSRRFGSSFSLGTALRYLRSDLSSGKFSAGQKTRAGNALAVDVSGYLRKETMFLGKDAILSLGINISNIGTKVSYAEEGEKFFLPANLKIGGASTFLLDDVNQFTVAFDLNKLLAPTQPVYDLNGQIIRGSDPDVSVPTGENMQDFGEAFTFDLPNSKIRIQSTSSFNLGADCSKKSNSPVMPDINVTTTLSDKIHERDKLIDYLMKEIR